MNLTKALLAVVVLMFSLSCKKENFTLSEEEKEHAADLSAANSLLTVEVLLNELEYMVRHVPQSQPGTSFLSCASISRQTVGGGEQYEVTFSPNSTCSDNSTRSGKVVLSYDSASGSVVLSPNNYKIGELSVKGTYTFTPSTYQQKAVMKLMVLNGEFSVPGGDYIRFTAERDNHFKTGSNTTALEDDVFEVLNSSYGLETFSGGVTAEIEGNNDGALLVKYECSQRFRPRGGKISFERDSRNSKALVFGTGNCADQPSMQ
ncbi:hypothetical protein [Pedobacter sp. SYSU D00535]|uniref:hypothetical protein n=1 Tax=Pedobacter sp. SYSU D00535 TaxID=2810308 RepID=UPI001A96B723|nr:hypothetical protein [Pedobacter sp. SYSU D00535]